MEISNFEKVLNKIKTFFDNSSDEIKKDFLKFIGNIFSLYENDKNQKNSKEKTKCFLDKLVKFFLENEIDTVYEKKLNTDSISDGVNHGLQLFQGDIFIQNEKDVLDDELEVLLLLNHSCDLTNRGNSIADLVFLKLYNFDQIESKDKTKYIKKIFNIDEGKIDKQIKDFDNGILEANLNIDVNGKYILSKFPYKNMKPYVCVFTSIKTYNHEEFLDYLSENNFIKILKVNTPIIESIVNKFGHYFSRIGIDNYLIKQFNSNSIINENDK